MGRVQGVVGVEGRVEGVEGMEGGKARVRQVNGLASPRARKLRRPASALPGHCRRGHHC